MILQRKSLRHLWHLGILYLVNWFFTVSVLYIKHSSEAFAELLPLLGWQGSSGASGGSRGWSWGKPASVRETFTCCCCFLSCLSIWQLSHFFSSPGKEILDGGLSSTPCLQTSSVWGMGANWARWWDPTHPASWKTHSRRGRKLMGS